MGIKVENMVFTYAYVQIFDLLDDCIMVVDSDSNIILYNKASEKLDGFKREKIIGRPLLEVFTMHNYTSSTLKCLETSKPVVDLYQNYVTYEGKNVSSISSSYPLMKGDEMVGVITITKDMSRFSEMMRLYRAQDIKEAEEHKGEARYFFEDIIGYNEELENSLNIARTASKTESNILLYGETGTGKELYAQSIHNSSGVSGKFVSINCAAIPENLLEAMLFGTSKGAYTGAVNQAGLFEEAQDGTLFLDELNSMSLNLQSKILRAVETGRIRRLGENKEKLLKPRIVSALNIHPFEAINKGILRRDLYYRLGVVTVSIPPLRDRKDDVKILINFFLDKCNRKYCKNVLGVKPDVLELFMDYDWPGNVRELEHTIEHSVIVCGERRYIEMKDLPSFIKEEVFKARESDSPKEVMEEETIMVERKGSIDDVLASLERELMLKTLEESQNNVAQAAKKLGLSRQTLDYRLKKLDIK